MIYRDEAIVTVSGKLITASVLHTRKSLSLAIRTSFMQFEMGIERMASQCLDLIPRNKFSNILESSFRNTGGHIEEVSGVLQNSFVPRDLCPYLMDGDAQFVIPTYSMYYDLHFKIVDAIDESTPLDGPSLYLERMISFAVNLVREINEGSVEEVQVYYGIRPVNTELFNDYVNTAPNITRYRAFGDDNKTVIATLFMVRDPHEEITQHVIRVLKPEEVRNSLDLKRLLYI